MLKTPHVSDIFKTDIDTFFFYLFSIILEKKTLIIKLKKRLSSEQYQYLTQCIAPLSSYTPIWGSIFLFYIIERMGLCPTTLYTHTRSITCAARRGERATVVAPPRALGELSAPSRRRFSPAPAPPLGRCGHEPTFFHKSCY